MDFVLYNLDGGVALPDLNNLDGGVVLPDLTPDLPIAVELPEPVREAA